MADGITIAQEGIDVGEALDAQKVLDSRWRYFEIAFERKLVISSITSLTIVTKDIFTHGLGFLPAFDVYDITADEYISDNLYGSDQKIYISGIYIDEDNVSGHEILLRIYNVPITEEYEAPIVKTYASKAIAPSKYGVKITENNDFKQQELSKYGLNTKGKALAIQKTGSQKVNSKFEIVIEHKLGFPPSYLATQVTTDNSVQAVNPDFVPVLASANNQILSFRGAQAALGGTWAYIIFKEPAEVAI